LFGQVERQGKRFTVALLDDIAREVGVSTVTVRNVLNGRNKETWPTAKQRADEIRRIAAHYNYRPNAAARATATGRFSNIALVLATEANTLDHLFYGTLWAVRTSLREHGLHLVIGDLPKERPGDDEGLPMVLRELSADGLLINCIERVPEFFLRQTERCRVPSVWMNIKLARDCVYPDDLAAGREATQRLIDLGHRRIAYMDLRPAVHYSSTDRREGYMVAMREAGLLEWILPQVGSSPADWEPFMTDVLSAADRPTAIVAYEQDRAMVVCFAALRLGLSLPADLSLITFHSGERASSSFAIDTMRIPSEALGEYGVETLIRKIEDPSRVFEPRGVPHVYRPGSTCGPPPG
jgi:LacI family transcriptional regulator